MTVSRDIFFLFAATLLLLSFSATAKYIGFRVLPQEAPMMRHAEVTKSLWHHHSLSPPEFTELSQHLSKLSRQEERHIWQDAFSLGSKGELFPKHSLFSCLIAVPFYAAFGELGFWICEQFLSLALLFALYKITQILNPKVSPLYCLLLFTLGTQLFIGLHSYVYSLDLHGATLLFCGLCLLAQRGFVGRFLGGLITGLSLFVRPSYALFFPFFFFAWERRKKADWRAQSLGFGASIVLFLLVNTVLFGGPFVTAYHRVVSFDAAGTAFIDPHDMGFQLKELFSSWGEKLLHPQHGLLPYNLAIATLPITLFLVRTHPARRTLLCLSSAGLLSAVYIFSYEHWEHSFIGNRFLLPLALISCLNLLALQRQKEMSAR